MRTRPTADQVSPHTFALLVEAAALAGGPPPAFLSYRRNQIASVLAHAGPAFRGLVLEIGGGVSGHAVLLTDVAERVICTDLMTVESSHGGDFASAARLVSAAQAGSLVYVSARAEALPFADRSIDTVFSSHVLEHVDDRGAAVSEIWRVLRPGGSAVILVPNRMEQIHRAMNHYLVDVPRQLIKAGVVWSGAARRLGWRPSAPPPPRPTNGQQLRDWLRPLARYPLHGRYADRRDELKSSGIREWDSLFTRQGFAIMRRFTTNLENHLSFFSVPLALRMQRALHERLTRVGANRLAVLIGDSYGFIAAKPRADPDGDARGIGGLAVP